MTTNYSRGALAQLCIDAAAPIDTSSLPLMIQSESIAKDEIFVDTSGLRGSLQHHAERVAAGTYKVSGTISLVPTADELEYILPYIQGAAKATNDFIPSSAPTAFVMAIDRETKVITYTGCIISRATFKASPGQAMMVDLQVEATSESVGAEASFPALTYKTDAIYMHSSSVLTMVSSAREVFDWELSIDWGVDADRFVNEQTRSRIIAHDRKISFRCNVPYSTANADLYAQGVAGAGASLVLTNSGGDVITFTMGSLKVPARGPTSGGRSETQLPIQGEVRHTGSTNDLVITHVLA